MEVAIAIAIGLFVGVAIGIVIADRIWKYCTIGTLRIDTSDSDGPYLFLELKKDVNHITQEKYITLKVNTDSYIPHE